MSLGPFLRSALGCLWRERRYSVEAMAEFQRRRLSALLTHAKETTPLWRERLAHVDPDAPDLSTVDPIGKDELMARFDESIAGSALTRADAEAFALRPDRVGALMRGQYLVATTSGTTGRVGFFVTDRQAWAALNGALFARILRHRLIPREIIRFCYGRRYRMAMAVAVDGHFITRLVATFRPFVTRAMVNIRAFSIMDPNDALVAALNGFRPHYLHGYPTHLEMLAHAKLEGALSIEPEFISLGSEPVSRLARETIGRAFRFAEVSETYGATECLTIANQCRLGNLHVNPDLCVLEPVDELGRPVPPGVASSKVYLTNLVNRAQPLIRYELLDSVTVLETACPCGTAMPVVRVEGRSDDTFFLADERGRFFPYPPVPFEVLFLNLPGLAQYQLVHEAQNHLRIQFVPAPGADAAALAEALERRFRDHLAKNRLAGCVRLEVSWVAVIPREAKGHKLRQVYSKVPRPELLLAG